MINQINDEIATRKTYGTRQGYCLVSGVILIWSNASASWHIKRAVKKNELVTMDANEIVAYGKQKDIKAVLKDLNPLPLYKNSFEDRNIV